MSAPGFFSQENPNSFHYLGLDVSDQRAFLETVRFFEKNKDDGNQFKTGNAYDALTCPDFFGEFNRFVEDQPDPGLKPWSTISRRWARLDDLISSIKTKHSESSSFKVLSDCKEVITICKTIITASLLLFGAESLTKAALLKYYGISHVAIFSPAIAISLIALSALTALVFWVKARSISNTEIYVVIPKLTKKIADLARQLKNAEALQTFLAKQFSSERPSLIVKEEEPLEDVAERSFPGFKAFLETFKPSSEELERVTIKTKIEEELTEFYKVLKAIELNPNASSLYPNRASNFAGFILLRALFTDYPQRGVISLHENEETTTATLSSLPDYSEGGTFLESYKGLLAIKCILEKTASFHFSINETTLDELHDMENFYLAAILKEIDQEPTPLNT